MMDVMINLRLGTFHRLMLPCKIWAHLNRLSFACVVTLTAQAWAQTTPALFENPELVQRYQQTIKAEALAADLYFVASDLFEGRETGTRGQQLAAHWLASCYRKLGLRPYGSASSDTFAPEAYFQTFNTYKVSPRVARLRVEVAGNTVAASTFSESESQDELAYFAFGRLADLSAGVIFAGYGISDDSLGYNDYAALDKAGIKVTGKWVMLLRDEPLANDSTSLLPTRSRRPSRWSRLNNKLAPLWEAGTPAGVLIIDDVGPRARGTFKERAAAAAQALPAVGNRLSLRPDPAAVFPPAFMISDKLANQILKPSGQSVEGLVRAINNRLTPKVFEVNGAVVRSAFERYEPVKTENVLAYLEGSDPALKQEVVTVISHYDHLGRSGQQIYNGAADDGSGTVAALALADAFMKARADGMGPRRSILFLHTSGEEKGLLGSQYFTDVEPAIPLDRIVAAINMDGVGGFDPKPPARSKNYIYIIESPLLSDELRQINERANTLTGTGLELTYGKTFSSDQRHFERHFIPFLYYSTGLTEHYHRSTDTPNTIDYEHMAKVVRLVFATIWQAANQQTAPAGTSRDRLQVTGYRCPPCPFGCDHLIFSDPGHCPICGMILDPSIQPKG
jgi:hypothetical protein